MLVGALALQGCARKTPAGATEETSRELTMESAEITKTEEISDLSEAKTTDASKTGAKTERSGGFCGAFLETARHRTG